MRHLKCTPTHLYAANKSFDDIVSLPGQTSNMKSLQLEAWEVIADLDWLLLKNKTIIKINTTFLDYLYHL